MVAESPEENPKKSLGLNLLLCLSLLSFCALGITWTSNRLSLREDYRTQEVDPWATLPDAKFPVSHRGGKAWSIDITSCEFYGFTDSVTSNRSPIMVYEDGHELKPHADLETVESIGAGTFTHLGGAIVFSTSDNSNPLENGREYRFVFRRDEVLSSFLDVIPAKYALRFVVILNLLVSVVLIRKRLVFATRWYRIGLAVSLLFCCACWLTPRWEVFRLSGDSGSYIGGWWTEAIRPPLYPWLIQAVAGSSFSVDIADYPTRVDIVDRPGDPLLGAVRVQKVILVGALLILALALMRWVSPPLLGICVIALLQKRGLVSELDYVMSEPLAQGLLLLVVAAMARFVKRPSGGLLFSLAAFGALATLTRPPFVFSGVLLLLASAWGLWHVGRRFLLPVAGSFLVLSFGAFGPGFYNWTTSGVFRSSPMQDWSAIAFAMQVADRDDLLLMPDEESREFLQHALALKDQLDPIVIGNRSVEEVPGWKFLNINLYQVSQPAANALGRNTDNDKSMIYARVSGPILKAHLGRRLSLYWNSVRSAGELTRVRLRKIPFSWVLAMASVALVWCSGRVRLFVGACLLAHIGHLAIICWFDMPLTRYIYASEPVAWVGLLVLGSELGKRLLTPRDAGRRLAA